MTYAPAPLVDVSTSCRSLLVFLLERPSRCCPIGLAPAPQYALLALWTVPAIWSHCLLWSVAYSPRSSQSIHRCAAAHSAVSGTG